MIRRGTLRDPAEWDRLVNSKFEGQPILSPEESIVAARKLYRHAFGRAFPGKVELASGNRYTWVRRGVLYVNPDKRELHTRGLRSIIHDLSHYAHSRLNPKDAPHSRRQARLEARLAKFAIDRNWHEGGLAKPAPIAKPAEPEVVATPEPKAKVDPVVVRFRRMEARRSKWEKELERAKRLFAKADREVRTYRRRHGARLEV